MVANRVPPENPEVATMWRFYLATLCLVGMTSTAFGQSSKHTEGLRENRPDVFALTGANVVVSPGEGCTRRGIPFARFRHWQAKASLVCQYVGFRGKHVGMD